MNPETQNEIRAALRALAAKDRDREASASAHTIFAMRPAMARVPRRGAAAFAAIGLVAAAALVISLLPPPAPQAPAKHVAPVVNVATPAEIPSASPQLVERQAPPKPVRRKPVVTQPREILTEFFPLMDAPPPFERGRLMRVVVPASTMTKVGLPVNADRWSEPVQAEVLVGEEGMARAIRFVGYQQ